MSFLRVLPFLLLALAVGVAGFAVGALTDPFGDVRRRVAGELSPEAPGLADRLARAQAEAGDLAEQLEEVRTAREDLRRELETARAEMERLRGQAGDAKAARDAARERYQELRTRTERLSARVDDLRDRIGQLRERLTDAGAAETDEGGAETAETEADGADTTEPREAEANAPAADAATEAGTDAAPPEIADTLDQDADDETGTAASVASDAGALDEGGGTAPNDGSEDGGGEVLQRIQEPAEARPTASALRAIDPTEAQIDQRFAGVEAYEAGDYERAYRLWLPLAQAGYPVAQLNVGALFFEGRGVPRDDVLAHAWLTLADENGSRNASGLLEDLDARMTAAERRAATDLIARATPSR